MAESLTLYTNPQSRGRIARWMLEEIGKPYDVEILDFGRVSDLLCNRQSAYASLKGSIDDNLERNS